MHADFSFLFATQFISVILCLECPHRGKNIIEKDQFDPSWLSNTISKTVSSPTACAVKFEFDNEEECVLTKLSAKLDTFSEQPKYATGNSYCAVTKTTAVCVCHSKDCSRTPKSIYESVFAEYSRKDWNSSMVPVADVTKYINTLRRRKILHCLLVKLNVLFSLTPGEYPPTPEEIDAFEGVLTDFQQRHKSFLGQPPQLESNKTSSSPPKWVEATSEVERQIGVAAAVVALILAVMIFVVFFIWMEREWNKQELDLMKSMKKDKVNVENDSESGSAT